MSRFWWICTGSVNVASNSILKGQIRGDINQDKGNFPLEKRVEIDVTFLTSLTGASKSTRQKQMETRVTKT